MGTAASVVFVALVVACVWAAVRARPLPRARWVVGTTLVVLVLVVWGWTMAPLENAGVQCIEEPLFGMSATSDVASPWCGRANRSATALWAAAAGTVTAAGWQGLRAVERRGRRAPGPRRRRR